MPGRQDAIARKAAAAEEGVDLRAAARTRQFWLLLVIYAICGFNDFFVSTHVVAFAQDRGVDAGGVIFANDDDDRVNAGHVGVGRLRQRDVDPRHCTGGERANGTRAAEAAGRIRRAERERRRRRTARVRDEDVDPRDRVPPVAGSGEPVARASMREGDDGLGRRLCRRAGDEQDQYRADRVMLHDSDSHPGSWKFVGPFWHDHRTAGHGS